MKSDEQRIAEAVAALRTRLESWAVEDAADKAAGYVNDMLRNGWRPRAIPVEFPNKPVVRVTPTSTYQEARAALRRPETEETKP